MSDQPQPKPRKKPVKPTREEIQDRVEFTVFLLCRRLYKCDIKRILKKKYSVAARTCEEYLARARAVLVKESGKTQETHRIESLRFYESVIAGDGTTMRDRLHAQERIDKLLGLESPQKHDVTTKRSAEDFSDDELTNIATGGSVPPDQAAAGSKDPG